MVSHTSPRNAISDHHLYLGGKLINNETIVNYGLDLVEGCWNTYSGTAYVSPSSNQLRNQPDLTRTMTFLSAVTEAASGLNRSALPQARASIVGTQNPSATSNASSTTAQAFIPGTPTTFSVPRFSSQTSMLGERPVTQSTSSVRFGQSGRSRGTCLLPVGDMPVWTTSRSWRDLNSTLRRVSGTPRR